MKKAGLLALGMTCSFFAFTANAGLKQVCEQTLLAQGNLAASLKTGDESYLTAAVKAGEPLGYTQQWYNEQLSSLQLNTRDREEVYYLSLEGVSPEYQGIHDKYMKTCLQLPAQYLPTYYDLVRRGLIERENVQKAEHPDTSNIEGLRHQGAMSSDSRVQAQNELFEKMDREQAEAKAKQKSSGVLGWMNGN